MGDDATENKEPCECGCGCIIRQGETVLCYDAMAKFRAIHGYEYPFLNTLKAKEPAP